MSGFLLDANVLLDIATADATWLAWSENRFGPLPHRGRFSSIPNFYIGAHAETEGLTLVTRDAGRYRTYFPSVALITP